MLNRYNKQILQADIVGVLVTYLISVIVLAQSTKILEFLF